MKGKEFIREIVTAYLVVSVNEPIIFSTDEEKVDEIVKLATKNNKKVTKRNITTNKSRIYEIGKNFFERSAPKEAYDNPIHFRNILVKEWHDTMARLSDTIKPDSQISWNRICRKYSVCECSVDEFSKWMFDINEHIKGNS